jgi:pimeloyl-ACP methyl ester carboxylesterase
MFDGFVSHGLRTARGRIFARVAGQGPPLLLLHGYPQTHVMWHTVADVLRSRFTVVVADLPGYGASFRPVPAADHAPHSKRALAADLVQAMSLLGFEQFAVAGHDRGGRVAYRMALLDDAGVVTAICEDYRAGATIDRRHDDADRGVRKIACPLLVLWGGEAALPRFYGDVLEVWRPWADDLTGQSLPAGHFLVEDEPERTAAALSAFLHRQPAVFPLPDQDPKGSHVSH